MTRLRQLSLAGLTALLAAAGLQCSGDTTQPSTASAIEMVEGDGQSAAVGGTLPDPLVVLVTDQSGDPVQGVSVQWVAQGGGSVSPATAQTGSDGKASVERVLGATPGQQTTTASVSGLEGSPVTFTATATEGSSASITITTNPPTSALTGEVFDPSVQPVVQVKDAGGNAGGRRRPSRPRPRAAERSRAPPPPRLGRGGRAPGSGIWASAAPAARPWFHDRHRQRDLVASQRVGPPGGGRQPASGARWCRGPSCRST